MLPPLLDEDGPHKRRGLPALPPTDPRRPFNYPGHHLRDEEKRRSPKKRVTAHKRRSGAGSSTTRKRHKGSVPFNAIADHESGLSEGLGYDEEMTMGGGAEILPADSDVDEDFESYIRLVESRCVGFIRISQAVYVVQGWNVKERMAAETWYHMQVQHIGDDISLACMCPQGGFSDKPCIHMQYYTEFRDERFREEEDLPFREGKTIMFWREQIGFEQELWLTRFSVRGHSEALSNRAIVTYEGLDDGFGSWRCSKDKSACSHIPAARKFFGQIFGREGDIDETPVTVNNGPTEAEEEDYVGK
ncbi:hypothetical protein VNI00_006440 [Paramarasmius palmivorus]|uniref:SWIM-type domain-containing protein n=1 Tax=Paramarasmius palmivorus TaxID=297713 RepID=A0AAW0D8V1_9AGAR